MKKIFLVLSLLSLSFGVDVKQVTTTPTTSFTTFNQRVAQIGASNFETFYNNSILPVSGKLQIPATFKGQMLGSSKFTSYNNSSTDTLEFLGNGWKFSDGCFGDSLMVIGLKGEVRPEWWGTGASAINRAIQSSNKVLLTDTLYSISSQIVLKSNLILRGIGYNVVKIKEVDSFTLTATQNAMVYGTNLTNIVIEGIHFQGNITLFKNDGINRHVLKIRKSNNCEVKFCKFSMGEIGFSYYDSCYDSKITNCDVSNNTYTGLDSYGHTSGSLQNHRIQILNNRCFKNFDPTNSYIGAGAGINTEETYFSTVANNICDSNNQGIRIENSCNNVVNSNVCSQNGSVGILIYNQSKRNSITSNQCVDNNVLNYDSIAMTPARAGNTGKWHSGIILEYICNNNIVAGNVCYNSSTGIGHQKYGIAINNRNMQDSSEADCNNVIYGNVLLNNEVLPISDRGYWNKVFNNIKIMRVE